MPATERGLCRVKTSEKYVNIGETKSHFLTRKGQKVVHFSDHFLTPLMPQGPQSGPESDQESGQFLTTF